MSLNLATSISIAAMALFVVLTPWQATLAMPGIA